MYSMSPVHPRHMLVGANYCTHSTDSDRDHRPITQTGNVDQFEMIGTCRLMSCTVFLIVVEN